MAAAGNSHEIRLTRVYDAPVQAVWDAWTTEQVAKWWGPRGFTITTHSKELRPGGMWRYTMHGPDGVDYPNITKYFVVEPCQKLVYDHGATADTPPLFRVTVTFTETKGKTTLELSFALASAEAAAETAKRIKQHGGNATWDRLAEHLEQSATGKQCFVINRTFDAPLARVFEMWTQPEHLARWLPPAGTKLRFLRSEIAVGKSTHFVIAGEQGTMHVCAEYLAIEPPTRIVYVQQFVDEREQPAAAPGTDHWPAKLRNTVLFIPEAEGRTRVTLTTEAYGEATPAELAAFVQERSGMTQGWTGSFDVLEALLA
jgi:uncharacterized protein YndB with AHSA1/START domain